MIKVIIKELAIMILLFIAIVLILGLILYDYIPTSKVIPNKIAYKVSDDVKEELKELEMQQVEENINITYIVEAGELEAYKKTNSYNAGKINPFAKSSYIDTTNENTSNNTNNTNTNTGNNNTSTNSNSSGTLLNTNGAK